MEQPNLIEPMKLTAEQIGERAQRLCDALAERDLLVAESKRATVALKEAISDLDMTIARLRGEIRDSRPSPWSGTEGTSLVDIYAAKDAVRAVPSVPLCTGLDTPEPEVEG